MGARWFIFSVKSFKSKIIIFFQIYFSRFEKSELSQFFDSKGLTLCIFEGILVSSVEMFRW